MILQSFLDTSTLSQIAHLSHPWSIGWVALSFLVCLFVRPSRYGNTRPNLHFFNIYRHKSPLLTQFNHISTSTSSYWLINTMYQPVPPSKYHHKSYSNVRLSFVHLRWAELYVSLVSKYLFLDPVQKWCNWVKSNTQTHWKSWRWYGGLLEIVCLQSCSWCNWR